MRIENQKNFFVDDETRMKRRILHIICTKYKNSVNLKYYLGIPLLTVSSGLSIYYYIKRKKINQNIIKPKKYNPKNPFIETEFDLGLLNEGNGLYFGLKTKF